MKELNEMIEKNEFLSPFEAKKQIIEAMINDWIKGNKKSQDLDEIIKNIPKFKKKLTTKDNSKISLKFPFSTFLKNPLQNDDIIDFQKKLKLEKMQDLEILKSCEYIKKLIEHKHYFKNIIISNLINIHKDEDLKKKLQQQVIDYIDKQIQKEFDLHVIGTFFLKNEGNIICKIIIHLILSEGKILNKEEFTWKNNEGIFNDFKLKLIQITSVELTKDQKFQAFTSLISYQIAKHYFEIEKDSISLKNLGFLYEYGLGVNKNNESALDYYKKSSILNSDAFINLGCYHEKKNEANLAIEYFMKGYQLRNLDCSNSLGMFYFKKFEYQKAEEYFKIGFEKNHHPSKLNLGSLYYRLEKKQKAKEIFQDLHKQKNPDGTFNLAICNLTGGDKDLNISYQLFEQVKEFKPKECQFYQEMIKGHLSEDVIKKLELRNQEIEKKYLYFKYIVENF